MAFRSDSRSRIRIRSGIRSIRRISPCYRHPDEPNTGICAACLRERLSGLDPSGIINAESPELRRCRSVVSSSRCEASSSRSNEPRRKSCDVLPAPSSLVNLFDVDDLKSRSEGQVKVESRNVSLSRVSYTVIEPMKKSEDEIRDLSNKLGELDVDCGDRDVEIEDGEFKTMKEFIDLEIQSRMKKSKDLREIAGSFLGAASVFTKKLRKWRQKNQKIKKLDKNSNNCKNVVNEDGDRKLFQARHEKMGENLSDIMGRRSCDTEPRYSIDAGRTSFEEPRASWDGYMIARTIPRLAPMFSVVENGGLGNINRFENRRLSVDGPMQSIVEDESSSGASGSGHSNSDSSSSLRRSSFDRSSSVRSFGKKAISLEDDHGVSPANVKLVITEKELKDWRQNGDSLKSKSVSTTASSIEGSINNSYVPAKKSVRWRSVRSLFGLRVKNTDNVSDNLAGNDPFIDGTGKGDGGACKLRRSNSGCSRDSCDVIGSYHGRRSVDNVGGFGYALKGMENFKLDRNRSVKYSPAYIDSGVGATPFYMTPLRGLKNNKSGKVKLQSSQVLMEF